MSWFMKIKLWFIYGLVGLERICEQLIAHGQRADMPVSFNL
jgi:hypothetical protein